MFKIKNPEGGYQLLIAPIITGALTAIGVVVGGLATKALTYGIVMLAIFTFANTISGVFIAFGLSMLSWGIQGPFGTLSNISMTNPANNYIVQIGWTLLRDLTNMFFILGLAYIGLATALNFASFNTKKTFTTLIIVALLINFTPVICGLIVDASNIIMNFFLSEVDFNSIADSFKQYQASMPTLTEVNAVADQGHNIWRHTLTGIYSILAGGVLTVFGAILLLRHFIIWLLVILSPLAFFCRIFDFSKQWYTKWWSYFVSWSFIGIPAAFFLYLSNHLLILAKTRQVPVSDAANTLSAMLAPYFVSVVFMVIALIVTLKIRTAGSSLIMNTANKVAGKVKAMPALIKTKVAKPMGDKYGSLVKGGLIGAAFGGAARRKVEDDALAQGRVFTKGAAKRKVKADALAQGKTLSSSDKKKEVASLLAQGRTNIQVTAIQKAVAEAQAQGKILSVGEKKKIAEDALKQNKGELRKLEEEKIKAGVEGGLKAVQENKRKTAALKERMGFKPRELSDLDPNELRELAEKPATTQEGLTRKAGAMKKMMTDNTMGLDQLKILAETPAVGKVDGALRAQAIKKLVDDDNFEYTPAVAGPMLAMIQKEYPGTNLQKLRKSRPDLIHLIDTEGYKKEIARLEALHGPGQEDAARNNLIRQQSSKMGAEDFAKSPIEDIPNDVEGDEMIVNMFLGMDAGKIAEYGKRASTRRKTIIKEIATPSLTNNRWVLLQSIFDASTATEQARIQKLINSVYDPNFL